MHQESRFEVPRVSIEIPSRQMHSSLWHLKPQQASHGFRDLFLNCKGILQFTAEGLRPHMVADSESIAWATMRSCILAFRTLPSIIRPTPRRWPTSRISTATPLNWKADVRAITFSPETRVSALMISSLIPSQKYSCSGLQSYAWLRRPATGEVGAKGRLCDEEALERDVVTTSVQQ